MTKAAKKEFYAIDFYATQTLQNGKEIETIQTVYFLKRDENGKHTDWSINTGAERGEEELKKQHFYKIEYKGYRIVRMNVFM
jgi:hypothetical protein